MTNAESDKKQASVAKVIASSGSFKIELIDKIGSLDIPSLIEISKSLAKEYGQKSILTKNTKEIY